MSTTVFFRLRPGLWKRFNTEENKIVPSGHNKVSRAILLQLQSRPNEPGLSRELPRWKWGQTERNVRAGSGPGERRHPVWGFVLAEQEANKSQFSRLIKGEAIIAPVQQDAHLLPSPVNKGSWLKKLVKRGQEEDCSLRWYPSSAGSHWQIVQVTIINVLGYLS